MPAVVGELSMLWESTGPREALQRRFGFDSVDAARGWLTALLDKSYGITVDSIDHGIISAGNFLAWLNTPDGQIIAKCCAYPGIHQRRTTIAELLVWLHERGIPVSAPLPARDGAPCRSSVIISRSACSAWCTATCWISPT